MKLEHSTSTEHPSQSAENLTLESDADDAQQRAIDRNEGIAHRGAWTIFSGLILEIGLVVVEGRPALWQTVGQIGADLLIALGVFLELHYAAKASSGQRVLQAAARARVAKANQLAQEARERAALIEKTYSWRRVSRALRDRLGTAIRRNSDPLVVRIEYQTGDPEAHRYANDIGLALVEAGVDKIALTPNSYPGQSMYGVSAAVSAQLDITRILEAFTEDGVQIAIRQKDLSGPNELVKGVSPNLYLFVGMKPWLSSLENIADPCDVGAPAY